MVTPSLSLPHPSLLQSTEDAPYQPLPATQPPINPPYLKACMLKRANQLDRSAGILGNQVTAQPSGGPDAVEDLPGDLCGPGDQCAGAEKQGELSGDQITPSDGPCVLEMDRPRGDLQQLVGVAPEEQSEDILVAQVISSLHAAKM